MGRDFSYKFNKHDEEDEDAPFRVSRHNNVIGTCMDEKWTRQQLLARIRELSAPRPPPFDKAAVDKAFAQIEHLFEVRFIDDNPAGVQNNYHLLIGDPTDEERVLINKAFVHFNHKGLELYEFPEGYWDYLNPLPVDSEEDVGEAIMVYGFLLREMARYNESKVYIDYC